MILKATSLNRKTDLRDACSRLDLKAACPDEAVLLAELYLAIRCGGRITVKRPRSRSKAFAFSAEKAS